MPIGMEVGLGRGHIVLDGEPAPHGKAHSIAPTFAIYGRRLCLRPSLRPYNLGPISIVAKRLD